MDNFYTILLYIGAILLVGLIRSINKAGKKKSAANNRTFFVAEEEKKDEIFDFNSIFNFLPENPVLPKIEEKPRIFRRYSPVLPIQNEEDNSIKRDADTPVVPAEKEESFILGDFDLPAAIIYSEILQRPNY